MANILDALGDLPSFFDQSKKTPGSLSYDELQMRRKIAMALASRRSPYPKTIGEGLSALGEGLADRWAMQDATKADAAYSAQDAAARRKLLDPEPDIVPGPPVAPVAPITPPPVAPQAAPSGAPPVAPGGAPAPALAPAPSLVPQRQPAPPPGPAIGALGGDAREMLARSMTNAQPEGPVGMPSVPEGQPSIQLASLQPPTEPGPRPPTATATVPASVPSTVPTGEMPVDEWKARVARIESGGQRDPYQALGQISRRGDRAYGKYQVMGENIPSWTKEHLGQSMTPQEFLADPQAQEAVAAGQGQKYISKYGPEGAAKAWFAGPNGMNDPNRKDTLGTAVSEYARRFNLPLEGREQLARSLANPPPQDLASGEDARLADVTGQAAVQPRVQLASLRNEPTSDAASEPMGGVAGAGIGQAADARREIAAAALAQQQPETMGLPAKVAQGPGPGLPPTAAPGPVGAPAAVPPTATPIVPPQAIPKAPATEEKPTAPGTEPTLQSVLAGEPRLQQKLQKAREIMADPRYANSPTAAFAEKVFTDTRKEIQDEYTRKWTRWHELDRGAEAFRLGKEKQDIEIAKARGEAGDAAEARILKHRLGGQDPGTFFTGFGKQKQEAEISSQILTNNRMITDALKDGVIQGWGTNFRLNVTKIAAWAAKNGFASEQAANTELVKALTGARYNEALKEINPAGSVSNYEGIIARQMSGTDPALEPKAFLELLRKSSEASARTLNDFEDKRDYYLGGTRAERQFDVPAKPIAPTEFTARLLENRDDKAMRAKFNDLFGEGTAELTIERAKRRERRGQ